MSLSFDSSASHSLMPAFVDDFNRPDGPLGDNWIVNSANAPPTIAGNQVVGGGAVFVRWVTPSDTVNQFAQATYRGGDFNGVGVCMAAFDSGIGNLSTPTMYTFRRTGTRVALGQKDAGVGSTTTLENTLFTVAVGDVFRLEWNGTTLTGIINGVSILTHNPLTPITGQNHVGFLHNSGKETGIPIWDDWSGGDIEIAPTEIGAYWGVMI